jgi:hypothetical protein
MASQVTLRDLSTNEDIVVPPEGFIFGRVGGDADIQIEDNSISRRQARVSLKNGQWLLETLAVPQGQRPPRPVALQEGATFNVGQSEFEVVQVEEEEEMDPGAKTVAPPSKGKSALPPAKKAPAPPMDAKTTPAAPAQKRAATNAEAEPAQGGGDEAPAKGISVLFVGVPKGLAYYLINVPKLLVNPVGTVRKTIEEQPNEPMGKIELIGYALPALVLAGALGSIARGLAQLIGPGHVFELMAFIPVAALIGGVLGALITGWFFHPVLTWVLDKLKGTHDARSRSNYFLQMQTVALVVAVPNALGTILGSLPIPFINLLGPLLMIVGTLASLYVVHAWMVHFEVVKWVLIVIKVLAVLALLGTGLGFVTGLIATIRGLGSGGGGSAEIATGDTGDVEKPEGALEEMPTDPEELKAWQQKKVEAAQKKAAELQKKALAAANAGQDTADNAVADAKDTKKDAPPEPKPDKKDTKKDPEPKVEDKPTEPEPVAVKDTPPPPVKDTPAPAASGAYGSFARKRDAIEKLFETDPTVLQKSDDLKDLYARYLKAQYDLDKKWGKETANKPELARLHQRLRDADLFSKSGKTIDQMAEKLKIK